VNNSWGKGMVVNHVMARRMIADAAALGVNMFHMDAGFSRWAIGTPIHKSFPRGLQLSPSTRISTA
jgi:hypothetical protein